MVLFFQDTSLRDLFNSELDPALKCRAISNNPFGIQIAILLNNAGYPNSPFHKKNP